MEERKIENNLSKAKRNCSIFGFFPMRKNWLENVRMCDNFDSIKSFDYEVDLSKDS